MLKIVYIFISTFFLFLAIDAPWIAIFGAKWYKEYLSHLTSGQVEILPAILFYLIYISGILFFVVLPGISENTPLTAIAFHGAMLGFFAYSTYDLTNHVFMKNWPWFITVTDIVW
ncbi:DUF2177 family protein [Candidatus Peribacteria bacterium]|nr:DUF2177 family protein [Candidatus Peribacteria bacterium]